MKRLLANDRTRSAIELAIVLALAEIWFWSGVSAAIYRALAGAIIAAIVLKNVLRPGSDAGNTGRRLWSTRASWMNAIAITCVLAAGAILIAELLSGEGEAWRLGRIEPILEPAQLANKALIVAVQQLVLCLFFYPSLYRITGNRKAAVVVTAIVFGVLHLPSLLLAGLAVVAAAVWLFLFERSQRLAPLIASHIVLAVVAAAVFPERLSYNLAVGRNALPVAQNYERLTEGAPAGKYEEWKSNAYYEKNGNADRAFIIALYRDVLRRSAAESEIETLLLRLHRSNRAEVVARFMSSKEFLELRCRVDAFCN